MATKPWWLSKTMWVNILTALAAAGTAVAGVAGVPPKVVLWAMVGVAVLNAWLRLLTNTGIK